MLQIDGSGKPRTSIPPQELNLNSPSLIIELGKHVRALERFQEHLIRLQTSQQQLDIVENRLKNTRNLKRNSKKKYVEVLNADEITTEKKYIETGLEGDEGMVEVTSGLNGGEKVVTFVSTK